MQVLRYRCDENVDNVWLQRNVLSPFDEEFE